MIQRLISFIWRPISGYMVLFLLVLTIIAWYMAGEQFKPTIKFLYQWMHGQMVGMTNEYPEVNLQYHAGQFFSKLAAIFLTAIGVLFFASLLYGPLFLQYNILNELSTDKTKLAISYRELAQKQTETAKLTNEAHQQLAELRASIDRSISQTEQLNSATNTLQKKLKNISAWLDHIKNQQAEQTAKVETQLDHGDF